MQEKQRTMCGFPLQQRSLGFARDDGARGRISTYGEANPVSLRSTAPSRGEAAEKVQIGVCH